MGNQFNNCPLALERCSIVSALRGTAAPGLLVGAGASYRSRRAVLSGVAGQYNRVACVRARPNPSVNRTSNIRLRLLSAAGYLKR